MSEEQRVAAAAAHGNPAAVPAAAVSADRHGDGHDPAAAASAADLVPAEPPAPVAPARPKVAPEGLRRRLRQGREWYTKVSSSGKQILMILCLSSRLSHGLMMHTRSVRSMLTAVKPRH